jgi:hypothetical protein
MDRASTGQHDGLTAQHPKISLRSHRRDRARKLAQCKYDGECQGTESARVLRGHTCAIFSEDAGLGKDFPVSRVLRSKTSLSTPIRHGEMGLAFRDVKPNFRIVMQKWLLAALPGNGPKL